MTLGLTSVWISLMLALPAFAGCGTSLPSNLTLRSNPRLPDPFAFYDGTRVTSQTDWACRREEINELFQRIELGTLPPKPESVKGSITGSTLTVDVSHAGKSITFAASIQLPPGSGPFPAIIALGGYSIPAPPGVAMIIFNNDDVASNGPSRGLGKFFTLYGSSYPAGALTAWAWGISRIIDALETTPSSPIDLSKLGVTGCSRNARGALVAGALEPRIVLTIPQESGNGGAGCWRISDAQQIIGPRPPVEVDPIQTLPWFSPSFGQYARRSNELPFDHHLLAAMVAPRGLLVIDHSAIDWLVPQSVFGCMKAANKVYQALRIADNMGISQVGAHNHCQFPSSQQSDLDAFVDKFLRGNVNANTSIIRTDSPNNFGYSESQWVDWATPTLS
ncbi:hypothetical protein EST38_g2298 [Candolleomyces aberdarensis]|uniref:(4-O-methyl)-D-glucuronate--lignin esterase n=1 Tax=Candolleomyces aberdarensis TaxID=2316362 RepID=A0A4Q2DX62_9AGAR|nr:hypothetical protein EST38_g2298 [Candolleomyces aberdarensis]